MTAIRGLLPWLLAGALAASVWFIVLLLQRVDAIEARLERPPVAAAQATGNCRAVVPDHIADRLGLTKEQCQVIEGCSVT